VTLRLRLLLLLVGIVAAGLIVADVVTFTSLRSYLYSQVDQQLTAAPNQVTRALQTCIYQQSFLGSSRECQLPLNAYSQIPTGTFAQLRDSDGNVLYSACLPGTASSSPGVPSPLPVSSDPQNATYFSVSGTGCGASAYRGMAVTVNAGTVAPYVVVVAVPLTAADQTLGRLRLIEVLVSLAVLAALGALAWWIVRRGLRPLEQMAETAGAIAGGDLSRRVPETDPRSEVGKLGTAFNTMLSEIEQAFAAKAASEERLRRFLADASHELRTPLTSIRGYAELFDLGTRERPEDLETSMRHIKQDAHRMSLLVDDLLLLSRLDRERPLELEHVDLAEIARSAVEGARVSAPDRTITLSSVPSAWLVGDADRLRQVVDNLLGNAVRHTPPATPVEVRVHADRETVGLEVADHGPGVPLPEQARIFEPFHRADPSRARSSGGVGLGLAIVSAIARAHAGAVGVVSDGASGATFWVQLPRAAASAGGEPGHLPGPEHRAPVSPEPPNGHADAASKRVTAAEDGSR
jgi:two-component system OmpR family sensor kinase